MKTDIIFTKEDLINAFKLHYNTKYPIRSRLMLIAGLVLWFLSILFTFYNFPENYPFTKYLLGIIGIFYIAMFYYRRKKLFERASNQKTFKGAFSFETNNEGIVFGKEEGVSNCKWEIIIDIVVDANNMLFYFGKDKFYILPLKNLTLEQLEEINNTIKNKNIKIIEL